MIFKITIIQEEKILAINLNPVKKISNNRMVKKKGLRINN